MTFVKKGRKFNKYWKDTLVTFCLMVALEPRLKLTGVQFFLKAINNNMENTNLNTFSNLRSKLQTIF